MWSIIKLILKKPDEYCVDCVHEKDEHCLADVKRKIYYKPNDGDCYWCESARCTDEIRQYCKNYKEDVM